MSTATAYETLADRLRRRIIDGDLPPGGRLPSEGALAREQGIARGTVQKAIRELVGEGLVVSRNGRGHYVRQSEPLTWWASDPERNTNTDPVDGPSDAWSRSVRAEGHTPTEVINTEIVRPPENVRRWLRLTPGEYVVVRRRVRFVDGKHSAIADSFYPRSIVAGTEVELPDDVLPGIYAVYERLGRAWVYTPDDIIARMPSREESRILAIPRGVAVIEMIRLSYDADNIPVRLTHLVLRGDRNIVRYGRREDLT